MNLEEIKKARYKMNWNSEQASKALKKFRSVRSGSLVLLTFTSCDAGVARFKVTLVHKNTMVTEDFSLDLFFLCPVFTYSLTEEGTVGYRVSFASSKSALEYAKETLNNTREVFDLGRILVEEN